MTALFILLNRLADLAGFFRFLPPLLARVSVGWVFVESGWGKLQNLEQVRGYFASLNIPAAHLQAPFVAGLEFIGGLLLLAGLATRLISLPLIGVMAFAILTARAEELTGMNSLSALAGFIEYLYILLLAYLVVEGPGLVSFDTFLRGKIRKQG